jgi:hypothetical protein
MTKEELKNAISETIYSNGKKGISGDSLANLLNEIVDAAGEGSAGGVENVFTLTLKQDLVNDGFLFSEPNEANALIRQKIVENIANEVSCTLYLGILQVGEGGAIIVVSTPVPMYGYMEGMVVLLPEGIGISECLLNEDGSFTTEMPEQTSGE